MACTISLVINVNAWAAIRNIITHYIWDNTPIEISIENYYKRVDEDFDFPRIEKDITREMARKLAENWIEKAKKDCSFIYAGARKGSVPRYKNFRHFAEEEELPFKTMKQMQSFICNNF